MRKPVPLGSLINKFPLWDGLGCGQSRSVKHAQQVNLFFHFGSKIVHIYFSPWMQKFYSVGLEKWYKPMIWLDRKTKPFIVMSEWSAGLWSWGTYHLAEKEYSGPFQRPSERDHQAVLCTACGRHRVHLCNHVIIIVPVDDPAPLGARTSAGTMMARIGPRLYPGPVLETEYCRLKMS